MASRLDRLFLLLDTGSSPVTRRAAALQLGQVQKLHPHDLHNLLAKVRKYLHSSSWDTRIAASQAVEAIVSNVPQWEPPGRAKQEDCHVSREGCIPKSTQSSLSYRMRFDLFDIHMVMKHGGDLLASEGTEFDLEDDPTVGSSKEMLLLQRRQVNQRLGLEMVQRIGLDTSDLGLDTSSIFSAEDLARDCSSGRNAVEDGRENKRNLAEVVQSQMALGQQELSAPNKRRASLASQIGQANIFPQKRPRNAACHTDSYVAATPIPKEEPADNATDVSSPKESLWEESEEWPLEAFTESLAQDLFSASWVVRHGAATALREVVRLHGKGGGRSASMLTSQMEAANQLFLEDLSLRLLCVLALDKFGDFISDQVVAPVRETCAQTLGHILHLMVDSQGGLDKATCRLSGVGGVLSVLLELLKRPEWEARHGGLLGLKYLLAVRKDLTSSLIPVVFEPVFNGLQDYNDDVSAVAAAALVPITDELVATLPEQVPRVVGTLWDALLELDDLTSSTSSILMLLAALLSHSVPCVTSESIYASGASHPLEQCVPRLWPFLSHNSVAVRRSVLRSLLILTSDLNAQPMSVWLPPLLSDMLRLLYQRCLVETSPDVLQLVYEVWEQVVCGAPLAPLLTAACPYLSSWLCLLMHPAHLQVDVVPLQWLVLPPRIRPIERKARRPGSLSSSETVPEQQVYIGGAESLSDPPKERERLVLQCRCMAAKLLGLLSGFVTRPLEVSEKAESPVDCYARLVLFHLSSKSALQRTMTAAVLSHWVTLHKDHQCPASVRERVLECLGESIYFDEIASGFTRLQQDCRDFLALLRHFGVPVDACFQPGAVLTVDQASELATTVYQNLVQQLKLRPKVTESLEDKRRCVLRTAQQTGKDQVSLNTMVLSSLAGFLVCLGQLPEKLNPVIRPLMDSIRREENDQLQHESARSLVKLAGCCMSRESCPNSKVVKNLVTYLCSDPNFTPTVAAVDEHDSSSSSSQKKSGKPGILTLSNMQKSVERATLRRANSVSSRKNSAQGSIETADDGALGIEDEATMQRQNEIQRRGATMALSFAARFFGAELPEKLPSLWECAVEPLLRNDGASKPETDMASMSDNAKIQEAQSLVTSLQVLEVIGPSLHADLYPKLDCVLPSLCQSLDHPHPSVRHLSSRCLGMLARVRTTPTLALVIGDLLPKLGATHDDLQRQGAIEALACVIDSLGLGVVPYIVFLVVPTLGRMSDTDDAVRLMATHCFAALVRLMPLDGDIQEASQLSEELKERRAGEKHFLQQLMSAKHADNFELLVPINAQLRSYQQEGINWLAFLNKYKLHGILCDDMGLGKTLQSICILASDHRRRELEYQESGRPDSRPLPSLVVCPPTLTGHWVYEVEKFVSAKYLNPLHYTGPPTERARLQGKARKHNLVVASYDIVRNDIDFFAGIRWNYCILDEGHVIKNGRTKLARAIKQLQANHRLILTGTPIQNNVLDLWSLFDFLMPGFLGTERQFVARFSRPILQSRDAKSSSKEQEAGVLAMESLHRQVLPFLLRRVKDDVLQDLPPKIIQDYYCELSPLQVQLYEDFAKSRAKKTVDESVGGTEESQAANMGATAHVFQALQYLRKVCNHPKLVLNPQHPEYRRINAMLEHSGTPLSDISHAAKLSSLRQLLLDCGIGTAGSLEQESVVHAHRALIFCQLKSMLDIVEEDLLRSQMSSVTYLRLDGSVAPGQRHELVQRFNTDPSIDVLLLTTQVGGLGLNLTGADTVIFVEHDWNPMKDLQAMDRAHRIGQKKVVNVYRLITRGTLEEKIMGLQKFKLTIANTVITQENSSLHTMGTDQLLDLFTLDTSTKGSWTHNNQEVVSSAGTSRSGVRGLLENLPELWDSSKYESEYDLGNFLSMLKPK